MKVWVYESDNGSVVFSNRPKDFGMVFIGKLDLDVQTEKKIVQRNAAVRDWGYDSITMCNWIPSHARNVKVTYEVEE